jgi:light-regulated signal transduction histidine kinase (bacteriophytochrome)
MLKNSDNVIEHRILTPGGQLKYIEQRWKIFHGDQGRPVRAVGTSQDITDRKQAEQRILQLNNELEQRVKLRTTELETANKELETFSYSISHDLKAPLRHISGFIDLFLENRSTSLTGEELGYLDIISSSAAEMGKLIDAILSFSRLNKSELRKATIRSENMVRQVIRFFEPETQNRNITFNVGPLHDIEGDEELILQVWTNLISNAIKYTGKKPEALIEIGSSTTASETTYFIRDNGAGFSMKYADKLFGVFQRLHKTKDFDGIGIGLANVQRIISRHGGRCHAEGEPDKGATFYFSLPK